MTSAVPIAVGAALDHPGAHPFDHVSTSPVATHDPRNHALTVHYPELAYPPPTDTDDLTTTAITAHTTATNHHQNRFRHWHPAVPFPAATVPATDEGAGAARC